MSSPKLENVQQSSEVSSNDEAQGQGPRGRSRTVSFDLEASSQHEVTPYGEIYGIHPNDFMFAQNGFIMLLTDSDQEEDLAGSDEDGSECDDDCLEEDNWVMVKDS